MGGVIGGICGAIAGGLGMVGRAVAGAAYDVVEDLVPPDLYAQTESIDAAADMCIRNAA
jgi:hypothetical protein